MNKLVLNDPEVKRLVSKICRKISTSPWRPDIIVGVNRGGLIPAVMISQWFDAKHVPLSVSLRDHEDCESNLWLAELAFGYNNSEVTKIQGSRWDPGLRKNILIVDDINDSGATFNWIMEDWPGGCLPMETAVWDMIWNGNVKFAVLVDNLASKCDRKMDFCGMEINKAENDVWVDFPWEDWWTK
jgi:hypoxanthine phosphoribosyltransferase